ncbi:hypothetical protein Drorol1_Dr00027604 [Drosera rotundifolia]
MRMERYKLIKEVGDGTFGSVWRALSKQTGEVVKQLKSAKASKEDIIAAVAVLNKAKEEAELVSLTNGNSYEGNQICIRELVEILAAYLQKEGLHGKTVTLKLKTSSLRILRQSIVAGD